MVVDGDEVCPPFTFTSLAGVLGGLTRDGAILKTEITKHDRLFVLEETETFCEPKLSAYLLYSTLSGYSSEHCISASAWIDLRLHGITHDLEVIFSGHCESESSRAPPYQRPIHNELSGLK